MKINDQQFGRPQILYKATKAQIEATPNPQPGMVAFATDTNQMGIYTSGGWQWGSGGDMLKAVYDTDNNGVVDAAESVDWSGVQNKPSTYPPSSHQHDAGDVTSGVFDAARIPNLDASKITSGTLSTDRFSAFADLQAESKLNWVAGGLATVTGVRYEWRYGNPSNDFTTASIPSGFYWAGSPFETPSLSSHGGSFLGVSPSSAPSKSFLVPNGTPTESIKVLFGVIPDVVNVRNASYIGFRLDDGTDQNYCELALSSYSDYFNFEIISVVRSSGNTTVTSAGVLPRQAMIRMEMRPPLSTPEFVCYTQVRVGSIKPTLSFTPTRVGIIFRFYATWERYYIDGLGGTWP